MHKDPENPGAGVAGIFEDVCLEQQNTSNVTENTSGSQPLFRYSIGPNLLVDDFRRHEVRHG